jgi:hypothetical protein
MSRMMLDCRAIPSESGCTLTLQGEPEELLRAAAAHAVDVHGHPDDAELRGTLRAAMIPAADPLDLAEGEFLQIIDLRTDRIDEFGALEEEWLAGIGDQRTARWSVVVADRDEPGRYCELVAFPDHAAAASNSTHPATQKIAARMAELGAPTFRNLDVQRVLRY